jgi:hypothetical protein
MQAQACFNQEVLGLTQPLLERPPWGWASVAPGAAGAGGGAAASTTAGASGGAAASAAARGTSTLLWSPAAQAGGSGAGKDAAWVTNLRDKGMAMGRPPAAQRGFLEDFLIEIGERTAELCPKIIRGHGIKFLENCLVLKCVGMRGVLMKDCDTVNDEGEDLSNGLGGEGLHGLVVH